MASAAAPRIRWLAPHLKQRRPQVQCRRGASPDRTRPGDFRGRGVRASRSRPLPGLALRRPVARSSLRPRAPARRAPVASAVHGDRLPQQQRPERAVRRDLGARAPGGGFRRRIARAQGRDEPSHLGPPPFGSGRLEPDRIHPAPARRGRGALAPHDAPVARGDRSARRLLGFERTAALDPPRNELHAEKSCGARRGVGTVGEWSEACPLRALA
jgi:hypothetical protein